MKSYFLALLFLLHSLLIATAGFAADPSVSDGLASVWSGIVVPVLASLLLGLVALVLDKLRRKYNLQISSETQEYLESIAARAIALAEEKGAAYIKAEVKQITGREKLDIAIAHILEAAPKLTREQADNLVHMALARIHNAGATGQKVVY